MRSLPECLRKKVVVSATALFFSLSLSAQGEKRVEHELVVLLAARPDTPAVEQVVERSRQRRELPAGLGVGSPERVEFLLKERARGPVRDEILADPESPRALLERTLVFRYPKVVDIDVIQKALARNPHVLLVEENRLYEVSVTPTDPLFPNSLPTFSHQWGSYALNLPQAWDWTTGWAYVGIIDMGIDVDHEDLTGNFRPHFSYDYGYGDANVDEGEPQMEGDEPRAPASGGHGTHVAGIIGATADNGIGVAGACWGCSLMVAKAGRLEEVGNQWLPRRLPETAIVAALIGLTDNGAQAINMSFGFRGGEIPDCNGNPLPEFCSAIDYASQRDVILVAASGNDGKASVDFPALHPNVVAVGGIIPGGSFWDSCDSNLDTVDCPSNYGIDQELVAPARQVLSTFYVGLSYVGTGCDDSVGAGGPGYGPCTGTSMASPYIASSAALVRSVNPLLTEGNVRALLNSKASNLGAHDAETGYGIPNVSASVQAALGQAGGVTLHNRLTPLFSLYSSTAEDHLYTTVPQMAAAALLSPAAYLPVGSQVPGYANYPGEPGCQVDPCPNYSPLASAYIFTTRRLPTTMPVGTTPLVPLYRMSYRGTNPSNGNALNRDTTYATATSEILGFKSVGYVLDGIEGYVFKKCTPEPSCIPPGAVKLLRRYNQARDDFAIFPESQLMEMQNKGYTLTANISGHLGYVYPNVDSDSDTVIDGFEAFLGTNPAHPDSDCDGLSDGAEVLGFPANDPRSSPGCVPPVARFTFACSGLQCSFDGGASTDNIGITSYSWTFGDSSTGAGATPSRTYGAANVYTVTLTVTDTHGLTASMSRKVSVTSETPVAAEGFFTVAPCRIVDTRGGAPLASGVPRSLSITGGACGIPATAKAVSLNVTVVSPTGQGHLKLYPGNQSPGIFEHSTINFNTAMSPRANNAILRLATNGAGTVTVLPAIAASPGEVHLLVDVYGYFSEDTVAAAGAQGPYGFQSVTPCRLADTRSSTPIAVNTTRTFTAQGFCGIPIGSAAAALNLAMVQPTAGGHATIFAANAGLPPVPMINFANGTSVLANGARTRLSPAVPDIAVNYFTPTAGASVHAIIDAYGYFKTDAPWKYRPITACRAVDTRFLDQGGPGLSSGQLRNFKIQGNCGVPVGAKAAMVNLTVVNPAGPGFLIAYPSGTPAPGASALNFDPLQGTLANGVIVPLSTNAEDLSIVAGVSGGHVIIDVFGYFQ